MLKENFHQMAISHWKGWWRSEGGREIVKEMAALVNNSKHNLTERTIQLDKNLIFEALAAYSQIFSRTADLKESDKSVKMIWHSML